MVLLALLVLAVYALSALSRVGSEVAATGDYRTQARQNALMALGQAIGGLQRYAGGDDRLTGMAGITGLPGGPGQPARHWGGVWDDQGQLLRLLVSGAEDTLLPQLNGTDTVAIVANGSVGADGTEHEHVRAGLLPVNLSTREGGTVSLGHCAWWVGDEGVKLSAVLPEQTHGLDALVSLSPDAPELTRALSYEQLSLVPGSATSTALAGQLRTHFHALTRTHLGLVGALVDPVPGRLNINTTSYDFWLGVAATYNRLKPASSPTLSPVAFADRLTQGFPAADPGAGKRTDGPYPSVDLFLNSTALTDALAGSGGTLLDFGDVMRPWLSVRSDTFRVRAYGDAVNPSEPGRIEAAAWVEAIVQRVKDAPADSSGRFVISYFRWLRGPNPSDPLDSDL